MVETIQFLAFPDNILNFKSHLDFETLILNLPEKIVQDLDQSIAKLKSMDPVSSLLIVYLKSIYITSFIYAF